MGMDNPSENQFVVKDLQGSIFLIQANTGDGFMAYDYIGKDAIEYIPNADCPYVFGL